MNMDNKVFKMVAHQEVLGDLVIFSVHSLVGEVVNQPVQEKLNLSLYKLKSHLIKYIMAV
jgi:hypothetical protein